MRCWLIGLPLLFSLAGCSSDKPIINTSQSLVMESSVLSAGIITDEPTVDENDGQKRATSVLYNQRETPVIVHYRYYWYDDKGLEITPEEPAQTVTVPAQGSIVAASQLGNLTASKVRLYLFL
ncbi:YcfL family protein [Pantoea sp. C2G6]|uniref:YcfL family protein n=1 Tax=Pantoea sp. C2G6 TaxID=3243084 RepID=UPI003ED867CF